MVPFAITNAVFLGDEFSVISPTIYISEPATTGTHQQPSPRMRQESVVTGIRGCMNIDTLFAAQGMMGTMEMAF